MPVTLTVTCTFTDAIYSHARPLDASQPADDATLA